jgi:hypothetical protein
MNSQPLENEKQGNVSALITIDIAELSSLVRAREAQRDLPPASPDLRVGRPMPELLLSRTSATPPPFIQLQPSLETMLPVPVLKLHPASRKPIAMTLRQIDRDMYKVLMAPPHGAAKPVELDIPAGLPRITNVATLKAMVGAGSSDVVFRRDGDGERWAVCPDDYPVDLEDRTQVFKIREFAILS